MADKAQMIIAMKEEIKKNSRNPKAPLVSLLSQLYKEAKASKDEALLGFVCFHYADYYYFIYPDYDKFQKYLKQAIKSLLNSDEESLLGSAYNLIAVDAHNSGSYSIAYQYYLIALSLAKKNHKHALCAAIAANVGRVLVDLENYELADQYFLESLDQIQKSEESALKQRYWITLNYLRGMNCMFLHKKREAKKCLSIIEQLVKKSNDKLIHTFRLPYLFLKGRILLENKKAEGIEEIIQEMISLMKKEVALFDYMEDIYHFTFALLKKGYHKEVQEILQTIAQPIENSNITRVENMYYELKLRYDKAMHHEKDVIEDMQRINDFLKKQEIEQYEHNLRAIEYSSMMVKLRSSQKEAVMENERLQERADTDALTGLANRYAMNDYLDAAYEKASIEKKSLAIGVIDVDYFKEYNDLYGHQAGDVCLNAIAGSLRRIAKQEDIFCARYGGDEFVLIIEDATEDKIKKIADGLREDISSSKILHKGSHIVDYITVTQGYCSDIPNEKTKLWDFFMEADKALYSLKRKRGKVSVTNKVLIRKLEK
ncbi:MAG: GGDEF domain-containing protein [Solobacterium sp.]|nr:GGDEF domain-containing protein [Solobacterium sp.]